MTDYADVPPAVLERIRSICMGLPDAHEEPAWTGVRWRVRQRTFAHVLTVEGPSDAAHTREATLDGPTTLVTFRSEGEELAVLRHAGHPFFAAGWGRNVVGMVLDGDTDWDEVSELLTESYCLLAPKKLVWPRSTVRRARPRPPRPVGPPPSPGRRSAGRVCG